MKQILLSFSSSTATRSGIGTVIIKSVVTQNATVTVQAGRKRKDTERGGTERKKRGATNPHAGK